MYNPKLAIFIEKMMFFSFKATFFPMDLPWINHPKQLFRISRGGLCHLQHIQKDLDSPWSCGLAT
jgi:hypothetical protein